MAASGLESYLSEALDVDVTGTEVLHDGLNLTIAVSTEEAARAYVVRRPKELRQTSLFVELEREYRLLQRLRDTAIPAPAPVLFCDDGSVIGGPFAVLAHLDGSVVSLGDDLPERFRDDASRRRVADRLVDALAEIHSLDVGRFEDICERQTPREQVARATARLDEATSVTGREHPTLRSVAGWLRRNAPSTRRTTLVHGDFRPGNVLFAGADRPELTGVIDWETAMLGDPLTELGYLLLRWRDDDDPTPSLDALDASDPNDDATRRLAAMNEDGLAPFTAKPGSPSRRELVARYEDATGTAFEHDRFYRAHAAFVLATVWADLHRHRTEAGAESDFGPLVDYMSAIASSIVSGELRL